MKKLTEFALESNTADMIYEDKDGRQVVLEVGSLNTTDPDKYLILIEGRNIPIQFQKGAQIENGINGATNECLLSILIHRTEELDQKLPCEENKQAIEKMKEALALFDLRTKGRIEKGVEGTELPISE